MTTEITIAISIILAFMFIYFLLGMTTKENKYIRKVFTGQYKIPVEEQLEFISDFISRNKGWDGCYEYLRIQAQEILKEYAGVFEDKEFTDEHFIFDNGLALRRIDFLFDIIRGN